VHAGVREAGSGEVCGGYDLFVKNRRDGTITQAGRLVELAPGDPHRPGAPSDPFRLSADGRYLAFTSEVGGLVADDTNSVADVFIVDQAAP